MKKLYYCLMLILAMLLPVMALAEGELPTDPFAWKDLVTIPGCTLATLLFVQWLKLPLDRIWKIPTRIVVYFIALILSILATYFTDGLTASSILLIMVNTVIIALAAMGAYEMSFRASDDRKKEQEIP